MHMSENRTTEIRRSQGPSASRILFGSKSKMCTCEVQALEGCIFQGLAVLKKVIKTHSKWDLVGDTAMSQ